MNEEVWYFIGAVVLLVINYCMASKAGEIANDKGYDENLWKWSCFFFAIAYILVAAMPDLKERDILKEINKNLGQNKGLKNDGDAGEQVLTTPASERAKVEEPIPEYWVCKRCGFTNTKEAHYCKQCGDYKWRFKHQSAKPRRKSHFAAVFLCAIIYALPYSDTSARPPAPRNPPNHPLTD